MKRTPVSNQITEGVIWKQLLQFFFPILLGAFFQQLYNTVDTIIVGRYVGTPALAAVGSTAALINLITGFFVGLSSGATVLLSQFYGANDRAGVRSTVHTGMGLALVLGVLATVLGVWAGPKVLLLTRTPENCLADATRYTQIYFAGSAASMIYNMGAGILRAMGDSRRPTVFLIATCFANIVLDLLLVVGLKMGVAGAALATIASQAVSAGLVIYALCRLDGDIALRFRDLRLEKSLMRRILYVGVPAGLQFVTFDLSNLLVQSGVNSFGDITVAAWTAYTKTDAITWMISGAFGVSITTFVGQNFGAQRYDRIRKSVWVCMGMSVGLVGTLTVLVLTFRNVILGIYTTDAQVIATGASIMGLIMPYAFVFMPVEVFAGAMRGTGYSLMPTVITCTSVCLFRVVWIFTLVRRFHTIPMLAACYPISWALAAVTFFITYLRGNWLKKRIAYCGMEPEKR
ncbi:MAG: MATE family efflux transporter [Eubacteriales bacterium]|nr:MATE family efflux transporter [Eubacteriales bacterium]